MKNYIDKLNETHSSTDSVNVIRHKRRLQNPSTDNMSVKLKQRCRSDTVKHCSLIHGSSKENNDPLLTGLLDAVTTTFKSNVVADKILSVKKPLTKILAKHYEDKFCSDYYKSDDNIQRSLNVYYSYNKQIFESA